MQQINNLLDEEGPDMTSNQDRVHSDMSEEETLKRLKVNKDPI